MDDINRCFMVEQNFKRVSQNSKKQSYSVLPCSPSITKLRSNCIFWCRGGLVVSALDQRPRGRGFESAGCAGCRVATVGQLLFAPWAWAYSTLHPLGVGRLQLGRYKAGTCDAAWCAPCTWAPLWWLCLLGALNQVFDLYLFLILFSVTESLKRTFRRCIDYVDRAFIHWGVKQGWGGKTSHFGAKCVNIWKMIGNTSTVTINN